MPNSKGLKKGDSMGRNPKYDYEALAASLFDEMAENRPEMTMREIIDFLDVPDSTVTSKAITTLRLDLGEGDTITVPVVRDGQAHIYRLSGAYDDSQDWLLRRARFLAGFVKTESAALNSLYRRADGRSRDGRALRLALTDAARLSEDLGEYLASVDSH